MERTRIVITGAGGFIGRHLIEALEVELYDVVGFTSSPIDNTDKTVNYIALDMSEYGNISRFVEKCDVFIPFAWEGNHRDKLDDEICNKKSYEANIAAAVDLIDNCGCKRIILPGSHYEYAREICPIDEMSISKPDNYYGAYKLKLYDELVKVCEKKSVQLCELRLFSIYGSDDRKEKFYNYCINNMLNDYDLELSTCTQLYSFLHIYDCVNAIRKIIDDDGDISGIYNLASDTYMQLRSYIEIMSKITRTNSNIKFENSNSRTVPNHVVMLSGKIRDRFKWHPKISFEEGVYEAMRYAKNIGGGGTDELLVNTAFSRIWFRRQAA